MMEDSGRTRGEDEVERLRQALEAETEQRLDIQRKLDRANAEFEEFISVAAHNMRQSLRDVASFSQLMAETYAARLDSDAVQFLDRIEQGAARMQSLLADVVDYWASSAGERRSAETDMEAALRQALLCAGEQIAERNAVVTHDPLPAVTGDFGILAKVLHHLIRNAIEYCEGPSPRVHVSARRADSDWIFSVEDNGSGIEPAFRDRIFEVFKRLHGTEHPGNGLGLAFCKRAIEWHGGRIWMESAPGAGSTFSFSLPAAD
jgi:light-regulated signal transduction histidine kinase (bacteriophytochrome)